MEFSGGGAGEGSMQWVLKLKGGLSNPSKIEARDLQNQGLRCPRAAWTALLPNKGYLEFKSRPVHLTQLFQVILAGQGAFLKAPGFVQAAFWEGVGPGKRCRSTAKAQ